MRNFFRDYGRKLLTGYGIISIILFALILSFIVPRAGALVDLLASSIASLSGATTTLSFHPYGDTNLAEGDTTTIDVDIDTKVSINAIGATISFPRDAIEILSISKEKSFFDLWTEDTSIHEDSGEIHFSGGTTRTGGLMGTGTVITLTVRAKKSGSAEMRFMNVEVYPSNGTGDELDTSTHAITYTITGAASPTGVISQTGASISVATPRSLPSADFNGDGKVSLVDFSILTFEMLQPYNARYDLNLNGEVGIDDLSILLSKI